MGEPIIAATTWTVGIACPKCFRPINVEHHDSDCELAAELRDEYCSDAGEGRYRDECIRALGLEPVPAENWRPIEPGEAVVG